MKRNDNDEYDKEEDKDYNGMFIFVGDKREDELEDNKITIYLHQNGEINFDDDGDDENTLGIFVKLRTTKCNWSMGQCVGFEKGFVCTYVMMT